MYINKYFVIFSFLIIDFIFAKNQQNFECSDECLKPLVKIEKSLSYLYRNYENVCDKLEKSAFCTKCCSPEEQNRFFQYTIFYRMHCVEFEEDLENHLGCLREASYKADIVCREKCLQKNDDKLLSKEEKQKSVCKSVECSTICYYKEFSQTCPSAKDLLLKLNVRIADESNRLTHPSSIEKLDPICKRIHSSNYISNKLLEINNV